MTTLLDIAAAVFSAPEEPFDLAALDADPLLCPTCFGSGKPTAADLHIARALDDPAPTTCRRCKGSGRLNCERCGVRPCDRHHLTFRRDLCALCDSDGREKDPCAVCDKRNEGILHYPCGQIFCSERCARGPRHTCEDVRKIKTCAERALEFLEAAAEQPPRAVHAQCNYFLYHLRRGGRRRLYHDLRVRLRALRDQVVIPTPSSPTVAGCT